MRGVLLGLTLLAVGLACPQAALGEDRPAVRDQAARPGLAGDFINRLMQASVGAKSGEIPARDANSFQSLAAGQPGGRDFAGVLDGETFTPEQASQVWSFFADEDNAGLLSLAVVKSLVRASTSAQAHEALWGQLAGMATAYQRPERKSFRARSLLAVFEDHRGELLPLISRAAETESSADDMMTLMVSSHVFGANLEESVGFAAQRIPAALAATIERERSRNRPVVWEYYAFESMARWKDSRLLPKASDPPRTLAELDAAGQSFIIMFNSLHELDRGYREVLLRGLGPVEIFNAVVAGEKDLYRLGTSGYRAFLHSIILQGVREAGSLEAFLERARPPQVDGDGAQADMRRGMVFLRVASSFGLLDTVLETVRDRDQFIARALAALRDGKDFEQNSSVVLDLLTMRASSPALAAFKGALLTRLYAAHREGLEREETSIFGSMLSVYQSMADDHRDPSIDRDYPLDTSAFDIPFERLFTREESGGFVHRMFMRMDETSDDQETFKAFGKLIYALGGTIREERYVTVFTLAQPGRRIEIYTNRPTAAAVRFGMSRIAELIGDRRVETVIGRGHTSIIRPLQADAKRVLKERVKSVASVFIGSCGGDASVRDLIGTFGYVPFFTTKATGRQVINDSILRSYILSLMELAPQGHLRVSDLLNRAVAPFVRDGANEVLQSDARLYQVNMATVYAASLFDRHVKTSPQSWRSARRD